MRKRRRSRRFSNRIVPKVHFKLRQFIQTSWDQAEVIAVDIKFPERGEQACAAREQGLDCFNDFTREFNSRQIKCPVYFSGVFHRHTHSPVNSYPCSLAAASARCETTPTSQAPPENRFHQVAAGGGYATHQESAVMSADTRLGGGTPGRSPRATGGLGMTAGLNQEAKRRCGCVRGAAWTVRAVGAGRRGGGTAG